LLFWFFAFWLGVLAKIKCAICAVGFFLMKPNGAAKMSCVGMGRLGHAF